MKHPFPIIPMLVLFTFLILPGCSEEELETEEIIRPVRYTEVFSTGGTRLRTFSGTAQAGTESNLSFKVAGTVQQINVQTGDAVSRGELLAKMDPTDYQVQVGEAEAALRQARSQARNAESNYERIQILYENNNASQSDLESARTAYESASAQVESIRNRLQLASLRVSYTDLKAPADGRIANVNAEINENVNAGQPIFTLISGDQPEVVVAVPEILISGIRPGDPSEVRINAIPDESFTATVSEVGISPTRFATTFPVTVRMDGDDSRIRPGMTADVTLTLTDRNRAERMIIPSVAVGEDRNGTFVFVIEPSDADDTYSLTHRREVVVGDLTSEGMEIISGLVEGELVVTAGIHHLKEDQKVQLLQSEL